MNVHRGKGFVINGPSFVADTGVTLPVSETKPVRFWAARHALYHYLAVTEGRRNIFERHGRHLRRMHRAFRKRLRRFAREAI